MVKLREVCSLVVSNVNHFSGFCNKLLLLLLSRFSHVRLCATPETAARQAPRPWDSPGKNTGVVAISFSTAWKWKVKVKSLSRVRLLVTPWTAAYQASLSMGFSRQEYWVGWHCNKRQLCKLSLLGEAGWCVHVTSLYYSCDFFWVNNSFKINSLCKGEKKHSWPYQLPVYLYLVSLVGYRGWSPLNEKCYLLQ